MFPSRSPENERKVARFMYTRISVRQSPTACARPSARSKAALNNHGGGSSTTRMDRALASRAGSRRCSTQARRRSREAGWRRGSFHSSSAPWALCVRPHCQSSGSSGGAETQRLRSEDGDSTAPLGRTPDGVAGGIEQLHAWRAVSRYHHQCARTTHLVAQGHRDTAIQRACLITPQTHQCRGWSGRTDQFISS
jgi:hypothetical protein